jgi:hypothetical protein
VKQKRLGFRKENLYLGGKKTRVWVRGPDVTPKHIEREAVRYVVGTDNSGRAKVTISIPAGGGAGGSPEMPPNAGTARVILVEREGQSTSTRRLANRIAPKS